MRTGKTATSCARIVALTALVSAGAFGQSRIPIPEPDKTQVHPSIGILIDRMKSEIESLESGSTEADPKIGDAYGNLGLLFHAMELTDSAIGAYENARQLDPSDTRWPYLLGILHHLKGQSDQAAEDYRQVLGVDAESVGAMIRLGQVLVDQNKFDDAKRWFERARDLEPESASAWFGLGEVEASRDNPDAAVTAYEKVLELQPQATSVHYQLALALRKSGDLEGARRHMSQRGEGKIQLQDPQLKDLNDMVTTTSVQVTLALAADTESFSAPRFEAFVIAQLTQRDGIAQFLSDYAQQRAADPDHRASEIARLHYAIGLIQEKRAARTQAEQHYRDAIKAQPDFPEPTLRLADLLIQGGQSESALDVLDSLIKRRPEDPTARFLRAGALLNRGTDRDIRNAISDLHVATERTPDDPEIWERLAIAYTMAKEPDLAVSAYERLLRFELPDQQALNLHKKAARLYFATGEKEKAAEHLVAATAIDPDDPSLRLQLATTYGKIGTFEKAVREMNALIQISPEDVDAHKGLIAALILDERVSEAKTHLQGSRAQFGNEPWFTLVLARLLAAAPRHGDRDGERALDLLAQLDENERVREAMAMAYAEVNQDDRAIEIQQALISAETDSKRLARLKHNLKRYLDGKSCCDAYPAELFLK